MEIVIAIGLGVWLTAAGYLGYRQLRKEYSEEDETI